MAVSVAGDDGGWEVKINSDSRLVRYTYFLATRPPETTNLCRLFWRTVLMTGFYALPPTLLGFYVRAWIIAPWDTFFFTLGALIAIGLIVFCGYMEDRAKERKALRELGLLPEKQPSLLTEAVWGVKNRVCPRIEIER
jgi:hypothetical protein